MGARGLKVFRYRNRYYATWDPLEGSPGTLGKRFINSVPQDSQGFAKYLEDSYEHMKKWESRVMKYLCRSRADYLDEKRQYSFWAVAGARDRKEDLECDCIAWFPGSSVEGDQKHSDKPWSYGDYKVSKVPGFFPEVTRGDIEWVYTIDYDNHTFTVNNGGHVRLNSIPGDDWIAALADDLSYRGKVFVPDTLPPGAVVGIAAPLSFPNSSLLQIHNSLSIRFVAAQGIDGFSPSQCHGLDFRLCIFRYVLKSLMDPLSAALLSWKPEDFPFREIAFALLGLASGSQTALVQYSELVGKDWDGFSNLLEFDSFDGKTWKKPEFLTHLWTGSHLQGNHPGSAPNKATYWFEGALVHLVSRLDQPDAVRTGIAFVQTRCLTERPGRSSNALLLSVEHVVLLRVYSDGKRVDRTEVQTLFDIGPHFTLDPYQRYNREGNSSLLLARISALNRYKKAHESKRARELHNALGIKVEATAEQLAEEEAALNRSGWSAFKNVKPPRKGDVRCSISTFCHLARFLEASARENLRPKRVTEGIFPTEIYELVIQNIDDVKTSRACMQVSRNFRDLCLEYYVLANGMAMRPYSWAETYRSKGGSMLVEALQKEAGVDVEEIAVQHQSFHMKWKTRKPNHQKGQPVRYLPNRSIEGTIKAGEGFMELSKVERHLLRRNPTGSHWQVTLGDEKHRRTLLQWLLLRLREVETSEFLEWLTVKSGAGS